ncbi:hypothetical protein WJX74_008912 [Apatococcus lobatus]|uniref:Uncharacterized protein n=1 Tax=Apatococcus lobatus TaxID=904363 RepID=A0AAW1R2E5_9CHLO
MSKRMRAMGQQPRADRLRAFERLQKAPKSSKASGPAPSKARTKRSQKLAHCPTVSKPPRAPKEETIDSTAVQASPSIGYTITWLSQRMLVLH